MSKVKRVSFIATDIRNDCNRCVLSPQNSNNTRSCKGICRKIAEEMGVPFVYAVSVSDPEVEYYGC